MTPTEEWLPEFLAELREERESRKRDREELAKEFPVLFAGVARYKASGRYLDDREDDTTGTADDLGPRW